MPGIASVLTINGTPYTNVDRADARVKLNELTLNLSAYDSLAFYETSRSPFPSWDEWTPVSLACDLGDGAGSVLRFSGRIGDTQSRAAGLGLEHAYTVQGLRALADKIVPVTAPDGTGSITYNRPRGDTYYYLPTDSGLTLGTMFTRILSIAETAARLTALGVGGYSSAGAGATGTVTMSGTAISAVAVGTGGGGYGTTPPLVFVNSSKPVVTPAVITANLTAGAVSSYTVTSGGTYAAGAVQSVVVTTLPASTIADLQLLNVVPVTPVTFSGRNILSTFEQNLSQWLPRFVVQLRPDGVIRFRDTTDIGAPMSGASFVQRTITLPSALASGGDPVVNFPRVRRSSFDCATNLKIRGGPEVETAILSLVDGTLAEVFSAGDISTWTYYDYIQPKDASDSGTITSMTSTSATLQSDDALLTWAANKWSDSDATISMVNPVASGITETEMRTVTSNASLSAGGTSVVNWDLDWPTSSAAYTQYRIVGTAGGLINTWRDYQPREPNTGAVGLNTFIGAHLVKRSPTLVQWANATSTVSGYYTMAQVTCGSVPVSIPLSVNPVPSLGIFRFDQPTVTVGGQISKLKLGSPTTVADGLPVDVQIKAIYARGALTAVDPPDVMGSPDYSGTAAAFMEVTEYLDFPSWIWKNDSTSMTTLANEHLRCINNINYDVEIEWEVDSTGAVPAWDFLDFNTALNIDIAGGSSPWSAIDAPVRGICLRWNTSGVGLPGLHQVGFSATNRRRPFTGDDLYLHPQFAAGTPLGNMDGAGGMYGTGFMPQAQQDLGSYLSQYQNLAQTTAESSTRQAESIPPAQQMLADMGINVGDQGPHMGAAPLSQDEKVEVAHARNRQAAQERQAGVQDVQERRSAGVEGARAGHEQDVQAAQDVRNERAFEVFNRQQDKAEAQEQRQQEHKQAEAAKQKHRQRAEAEAKYDAAQWVAKKAAENDTKEGE